MELTQIERRKLIEILNAKMTALQKECHEIRKIMEKIWKEEEKEKRWSA